MPQREDLSESANAPGFSRQRSSTCRPGWDCQRLSNGVKRTGLVRKKKTDVRLAMGTGTKKDSYSFSEIAVELGVSHSTVRNRFRSEPDVLRVGAPGSKRPRYVVP